GCRIYRRLSNLEPRGTALDVGCDSGRAAMTLSKAFPQARVFGYDYHRLSIERAIAHADAEGANVHFEVVNCIHLPAEQFDLITTSRESARRSEGICDTHIQVIDYMRLLGLKTPNATHPCMRCVAQSGDL